MLPTPATTLHNLIRTVPVCVCTAGTMLSAAMGLFERQQSDIVVCVDRDQKPLGLLSLRRTLPYLTSLVATNGIELQPLLEPLSVLPATTNWDAIVAAPLSLINEQYYAVTDHQGCFQGIIESLQLAQTLLSSTSASLHDVEMLTHFLDSLPLPLMLQSQTGEVLQKNQSWQQELGEALTMDMLQMYHDVPGVSIEFCLDASPPGQAETGISPDGLNTISVAAPSSSPRTWQLLKLPIAQVFNLSTPLWIVLARDITEYRQLSQELAAKNADLIQLNRLKDEFLACITHELKTPLTAVLGLASLLKESKIGTLNARQTHYAQMIHQSGRHLMNVVNDILDLTRLETGQLHLSLSPVNLVRICHRAYEQAWQVLYPETEVDPGSVLFKLAIEPGLTTIVADELRLCQMLRHLLENALKFTPAGGEVGLTVMRWQGWIDLTIWDTGIGIPESEQHLLFQKFQQLESPLTRQFEGTGLGLVLTQRLARAHGGDVSFISQPGQGSQFTLLLPPHPPESSVSPRVHSPTIPNQLILVVEAVPKYIERLTHQLQTLGYRVVVARSGTEALDKARQLQPRAILLNPLLPLLSGWDVLTLLKADEQTQRLPIIITATQAEKQQARQYGADGFLALPIALQALTESLTQLQLSPGDRPQNITVLNLRPDQEVQAKSATLIQALGDAIGQQTGQVSYRIVEAEDLDQAEVLARVWHPQVLLLDGHELQQPIAYLQTLAQRPQLATIPLITLDAPTTQAAHQLNLTVYPCLMSTGEQHLDALFQVMQVAAGLKTQPQVLLMTLEAKSGQVGRSATSPAHHVPSNSEFLQALAQYLQTAGMRVYSTADWEAIARQHQQGNGDLLLFYPGDRPLTPEVVTRLVAFKQQPYAPPLLWLQQEPLAAMVEPELAVRLARVCDRVMTYTNTQTMDDLLDYIRVTVVG